MIPNDPEIDEPLDALLAGAISASRRAEETASDEAGPPEDDPIDDGVLRAWQAGRLDDEAAAAFEGLLAEHPEGRALARASRARVDEALYRWAETQSPRRRRAPLYAGFALAAAVLVGLGVWVGRGDGPGMAPAYVGGGLEGFAAEMRGQEAPEAQGTPVFRATGTVVLKLRPETRQAAAPTVHAFVSRPDAPLGRVEVQTQAAPGGGLVIQASAKALFTAPGAWRFYVALGPVDGAAGQPYAAARAANPEARWFEYPLVFEPIDEVTP